MPHQRYGFVKALRLEPIIQRLAKCVGMVVFWLFGHGAVAVTGQIHGIDAVTCLRQGGDLCIPVVQRGRQPVDEHHRRAIALDEGVEFEFGHGLEST